ncbi:response regulator [Actinoplanes sp. NPDC051470]|uniref:response regulator n=1 Tax=unclassified Actinoplanes TaxID=2626549 RepID=UPI0034393987
MGARLLIVEDTPHNLQLMTYLLESHGHTVIAAVTGEQGIELALAARPDLVMMDLQLPGIDGYEALTAFRSAPDLAAVPVIAVTSFAMVDDRDRALRAGFTHYMTKPIDPETFTEQINLHLPEHLRGSRPAPAATEPAQTTDPPTSEPDRRQAADILVLDDSLVNQTLLRSVLEPHGYHVRTAFTVEQAITAAHDAPPDLVLSDVHVGQQSGAQLLSHVRDVPVLAPVPFAFITATADWQDPMLNGGATRVIRRPIEPAALLDEVEALLNRRTGD